MGNSVTDIAFIAIAGTGVSLLMALRAGRKGRLLDDTPNSKALSIFVGDVEMVGVCVRCDPFVSHIAERSCVLYRWAIREHWRRTRTETYKDKKGQTQIRTVVETGSDEIASGGETRGFYLQDETGCIWVEPEGAELETNTFCDKTIGLTDALYFSKGPSNAVEGSTGKRTFKENGIEIGTKLFVRGRASERPDAVAAQIRRDDKTDIFIITPRTENEVSNEFKLAYFLWNVCGAICLSGFCYWALSKYSPELKYLGLIAGIMSYLILLSLGWFWMVYNSLVALRNRVLQARSLIEIQIKRRTDLIPRVVSCVQAYAEHEQSVHTTIATLRSQAAAVRPMALSPLLNSLIENYPELKAQPQFLELSKSLSETEDRIALARSYHVNIATFYNSRLERIPDCFVARLIASSPESLFASDGFERHPPPSI